MEGLPNRVGNSVFFSANTAFSILMIYTLELFLTCVRNSTTSMVRQGLALGAILSPVLISAGRNYIEFLSYGVFGVLIICCGVFVFAFRKQKAWLSVTAWMRKSARRMKSRSILVHNIIVYTASELLCFVGY